MIDRFMTPKQVQVALKHLPEAIERIIKKRLVDWEYNRSNKFTKEESKEKYNL